MVDACGITISIMLRPLLMQSKRASHNTHAEGLMINSKMTISSFSFFDVDSSRCNGWNWFWTQSMGFFIHLFANDRTMKTDMHSFCLCVPSNSIMFKSLLSTMTTTTTAVNITLSAIKTTDVMIKIEYLHYSARLSNRLQRCWNSECSRFL